MYQNDQNKERDSSESGTGDRLYARLYIRTDSGVGANVWIGASQPREPTKRTPHVVMAFDVVACRGDVWHLIWLR
jgi:hypothetical protein